MEVLFIKDWLVQQDKVKVYAEISDIEYFKDKLWTSLKIPKNLIERIENGK